MANSITTGLTYVPILDLAYKEGIRTADLNANLDMVQFGLSGKEIKIPKISLQGLGDHTRGGNYVSGDVTFSWETVTPGWDRSRKFSVDRADNLETIGQAFGAVSGTFTREKVGPEHDAYLFSVLAGTSSILTTTAATLSTGANVIAAVNAAWAAMSEQEVPMEDRILYITPTLYQLVVAADTTASREVFAQFTKVVQVPQSRFYTVIDLYDGSTSGEEAGGYIKNASTGKDINFMIVHRPAVINAIKFAVPKITDPDNNKDADNWEFAYRVYGIVKVLENKVKGIYLHNKA